MENGKLHIDNMSRFSDSNALCQIYYRKKRINNRGFSLVEIIIVIAIMAILIAVLAPMMVRYVERSRIAVDVNAAGSMARALKAVATDAGVIKTGDSIVLTWHTGGGVGNITVDPPEHLASLTELTGAVVEPKSQTLSVNTATKVIITVADTGTGVASAAVIGVIPLPTGDYAKYFQEQIKGIN